VVVGYVRRKIQGLPAFDESESRQFVMPEDQVNPPGRKWGRRATDRAEGPPVPGTPPWNRRVTDRIDNTPAPSQIEPAPEGEKDSTPDTIPAQEKEKS
jgi:hypothetical protein